MKDKTPIFQSFYKEEFEGAKADSTYLLSKQLSQSIWAQNIDRNANTYFHLSDSHWLVTSKTINIGKWIESYNSEKPEKVINLLNKFVNWSNEDIVWFCINEDNIIETSWNVFKNAWIHFLYCENDCPILIAENKGKQAIVFRSIGDFLLIEH